MPTLREFERWLTTSQAASELGKSRQGVTWMVENGKLRAVKTQLGWLIDPKSVAHHNSIRNERAAKSREKVCEVCGEEFTATRRDAKMCSSACKQKAYRRRARGRR